MFDLSLTEQLLYGGIILGILAGFVLAIINWIHLSAVSGKIATVENEIDKKNIEFNNLKKERASAPAAHADSHAMPTTPPQTDAAVPASPYGSNDEGDDEIQIVRNVRAGVDEVASNHLEKEVINIDHTHSPPDPGPLAGTPPASSPIDGMAPLSAMEDVEPAMAVSAGADEGDVMDVIDQNDFSSGLGDMPIPDSNEIRIALYSELKKDADFEEAWQKLRPRLLELPHPAVILDCSKVMFLYEKELGLLEKFRQIITKNQGSLNLTNCDLELKKSLIQLPHLSRCVDHTVSL